MGNVIFGSGRRRLMLNRLSRGKGIRESMVGCWTGGVE
jgi:hypothetical protein